MERMTVGFRPGNLLPRLSERASNGETPASISKRDLERLYTMLPVFLRTVQLPEAYLRLLLPLYREAWPEGMSPALIQLLPSAVEHEATGRGLMSEAEQRQLVQLLEELNPGERLALVDALERALLLIGGSTSAAEALQKVGLVRAGG